MNSILQEGKECYVCGQRTCLHDHHVYFGANRKVSEKNGFKVWLCEYHHNGSNQGVHCKDGKMLNLMLKKHCQLEYEQTHSREEFIKLIGRSYL